MPKVVEYFHCEICDARYETRELALECEATGTPPTRYHKDGLARFVLPNRTKVIGRITGVHFEEKTHKPLYDWEPLDLEIGILVTKAEEYCLRPFFTED